MSEIEGFEACRQALAPLLAEADQIRVRRDAAGANALTDALVDFINDSGSRDPSEAPAIAQLDALAHKAMGQMHAVAIGGAIDAAVDLAAELQAIGQRLDGQGTTNLSEAKRLRLTPLSDLIDRLTDTVAAAKNAVKSLDVTEPDEVQIARDILTAAGQLQALVTTARAAVGTG